MLETPNDGSPCRGGGCGVMINGESGGGGGMDNCLGRGDIGCGKDQFCA